MKDAGYPIDPRNAVTVSHEPLILQATALLDERTSWIAERVEQLEKRLDSVLMPRSADKSSCEEKMTSPVRPALIEELHRKSHRLADIGHSLDSMLERLEL
jgi:hypothetical protein